jgi:hypothetical protein
MTDLIPGLSTTPAIGIRDLTQLRTTHAEITDIISILYLKAASHRLPNLTCRSDGEVRRAISWAEQHAGELAARSRSLERAMRPATEKEIGQSLLFLGGAFPNAGKIDLTAFGELFMQYVRDAAPSLIVLQAACDRVIRTSRFLPTISEVLEAIAEPARNWKACALRLAGSRNCSKRPRGRSSVMRKTDGRSPHSESSSAEIQKPKICRF